MGLVSVIRGLLFAAVLGISMGFKGSAQLPGSGVVATVFYRIRE